jgi:hypothetical protein
VGILHTTDNGKWKIANVHGGVGTFAADFPKRTIKHNAHHTHKCAHSQAQVEFP